MKIQNTWVGIIRLESAVVVRTVLIAI